jgi:hypothetical protein
MTSFEAGFVKYAQEQGILPEEAWTILQKSATHPELNSLLNSFSNDAGNDPKELEKLSYMLELDTFDREVHLAAKELYNL